MKIKDGDTIGRSTIQADGSLVIPKRVREFLEIDIGDKVIIEKLEDHKFSLKKA